VRGTPGASGDAPGVPTDAAGVVEVFTGGGRECTLVDEFMVYGRPLTPAEIAALWVL